MQMRIVQSIARTVDYVACGIMAIIYVKQTVKGKMVSILIRSQSLVFIVMTVGRLFHGFLPV